MPGTAAKIIALAATAAALGPHVATINAKSFEAKKLGERFYLGKDVPYPKGAADMPAVPPKPTGMIPGHREELFEFWGEINGQEDVYEVSLARPLGIVFEDIGPPGRPQGVKVIEVQEGSNAHAEGNVKPGDVLVGVSAVRYPGGAYLGAAKPERDMFPTATWDFDNVVDAISSNEPEICDDVILASGARRDA
eukprot:CAMPEP_0119272254 /NCGR_PEP_ID=MMETSP1329-20130426/8499_1 /TAXON_ID=114041 /ORGANISM="Genus nov. species nov., Strain RCC1024" /LENGTH=192 /DNA_ID=CAMNT_0007272311 /DNA_START=145 /DNA_END=720 /DNA_ORIENTATION=-